MLKSPLSQFDVASVHGFFDWVLGFLLNKYFVIRMLFEKRNDITLDDVLSGKLIEIISGDMFVDRVEEILYNLGYYLTNFSMTLFLVLFLMFSYTIVVGTLNYILPKRYNVVSDAIFLFVYEMVQSKIGAKGLKFLPFIITIFFYILVLNFISLMPYSFAVTTHIIWTLCFTLSILSGLLFLGMWRHGFSFINMFIPEVPKFLYPLIIPLEMLSYIIRGFSLAIRLSANVLAGHTLTHIISDTVKMLGFLNFDLAIISLILLVGITVMEMGVACLQAYIFTLLIIIYINDVFNLSH